MGIVNVRDLATSHFVAGTKKMLAEDIISANNKTFMGIANELRRSFGDKYRFPKRLVPKFLLSLFAPILFPDLTRKFISRNAGYDWKADNSKSINELGMTYRSLNETVTDFFNQLIETKQV